MKKYIIFIMMAIMVASCRTIHEVQTVTTVQHDTLLQSIVKYDSVYLDNMVYVDRKGDTVYIRENHVEYKYKMVHDTVEVSSARFKVPSFRFQDVGMV